MGKSQRDKGTRREFASLIGGDLCATLWCGREIL